MRDAGQRDGTIESDERYYGAERTKAFVDAVVAIAMTLLVLPLMESVGEAAGGGLTTGEWLAEHAAQPFTFGLSFAIIALFWMDHHRQFRRVRALSGPLMWLLTAWMLTIVWVPVATAIIGQMATDDGIAELQYIGTMIVTCVLSLAIRAYLLAHPALRDSDPARLQSSMAVSIAMAVLYLAALILTLVIPGAGYFPMLALVLTPAAKRLAGLALR